MTARQGAGDVDVARIASFVALFAALVILFAIGLIASANLGADVLVVMGVVLDVAQVDALVAAVEADVARPGTFERLGIVSAGHLDSVAAAWERHFFGDFAFDLVRIDKAFDSFGNMAAA